MRHKVTTTQETSQAIQKPEWPNKYEETKKAISLEVQASTMLCIARESYQQMRGANIIIRLLGK